MTDEKLNLTTRELDYASNDGFIVIQKAQVAQNISNRLRLIYGEWFLDTRLGVPWFENVFVKNPDMSAVDIIIKSVISETPEVTVITTYSSTLNRALRKLSIAFQVSTIYGDIKFLNLEL
jgi:hypothetical protein